MFPSPELRRGNIDRYHKMFSLGENFSRKQMPKLACDTIASKMYVDRPWPRAGYLLRIQYNRYALHCAQLKEEIHNRFNLISEERVNIFKHNSENLLKIGWKIRKLWHFEVSQIFPKHFLTSRYEYANEWVDDVSLLAIYSVHIILKMLIFCPNLW